MNTTQTLPQIPAGLCQCGCGQPTKIATRSKTSKGWIKGQPLKFVQGHAARKQYHAENPPAWYLPNTNDGFCHCGCGQKTNPARTTSQKQGTLKGEPCRYMPGHHVVNDTRAKNEKKKCSKCGETKRLKHFYRSSTSSDGYRSHCIACQKADPSSAPEEKYARVKIARERNRFFVQEYYRTHPCVDCGEADPIVLEFDHVRGEKKANVSQLVNNTVSLETIKAEIDKCDVVCANCHRRRTAASQDWYLDFAEVA